MDQSSVEEDEKGVAMIDTEELLTTHLTRKANALEPHPDLQSVLDGMRASTASVEARHGLAGARPRRRTITVLIGFCTAALVVAGVVALQANRPETPELAGATIPGRIPSPSDAKPLLLPPDDGAVGGDRIDVPPGRFTTQVSSLNGTIFGINLFENSLGALPEGTETRTVGDRVVGADSDGFHRSYISLEPCSMLAISAVDSAPIWSDDALALLASAHIDNGDVSIALPLGWSVVTPPAEQVRSYEFTVDHGIADGTTTIYSAPGTSASAISGLYGPAVTTRRADFDGNRAWFSTYQQPNRGVGNNHLTWDMAGNAYDVSARGATQEQLVAYARTLIPASIAELRKRSERGGGVWSDSTFSSIAPIPSDVTCKPRALTVHEGS